MMSFTVIYNTFRVSQNFPDVTYKWFKHPKYNLAMGIEDDSSGSRHISTYCHKLHPLDADVPEPFSHGEYFCDPDTVLSVVTSDSRKLESIVYLPYVQWNRNVSVDDKKIIIKLDHDYRMGGLSILPRLNLPVSIKERHEMDVASELIRSQVVLQNMYKEPVDILYCYQDAAVLWFPTNNQENQDTSVCLDDQPVVNNQFRLGEISAFGRADAIDRRAGVAAGLATADKNAYVGILPRYAGFLGHLTLRFGNLVGIADFSGKPVRPAHILNQVKSWGGVPVVPAALKNRAVIFVLKGMQPKEQRTVRFYRMGRSLGKPLTEADVASYMADFKAAALRDANRRS
jgi:hypothetical protein